MNYILAYFLGSSCLFLSCQYSAKTETKVYSKTHSVAPSTSFNQLFFDSTHLEGFIRDQNLKDSMSTRLKAFYRGRDYQYAWFFKEGLADYATSFLQLVDDYIGYSGDSAIYNSHLHLLVDSLISQVPQINETNPLMIKTEFELTRHFFQYSQRAYQGRNDLKAKELEWFIPRKKIDVVAFLDSAIQNQGKNFSTLEPVNRQYRLLKNYLLKYYEIEKADDYDFIKPDKKSYKEGDSSQFISQLKKRLFLTGDFSLKDSSIVFTRDFTKAVRNFQRRYGFKESGIVTTPLINELKRPVRDRIRQILINMERIRWLPAQPATDFLLVNIPEFRLHVYEKGNYRWSMNIVTGSVANNTVIFTGTLKQVVFSPYWNVPPGILKSEILPAIKRNKNYLNARNMEWHGKTVRQKPGPNNALGLVKFLFPNDYHIYLHDTPAKSFFDEDKRAFSHGCIRLSQPLKLAMFLLRNNSNWDSTKIVRAMHSGKEQFVTIKEPVPVYIGYFTAWVDREGKLNFRDDVYGHDRKMAAHLFTDSN